MLFLGIAPGKCMNCRQLAVAPACIPSYSTEMEHDGRGYHLEIANLDVFRCENCGTLSLDDVACDRIFDALRSAAGLLDPSEIRGRREALGLSREELADLLQVSEGALGRWEEGAQLHQRSVDRFLRAFFEVEELRHYLAATSPANSEVRRLREVEVGEVRWTVASRSRRSPMARASRS